VVGGNGNGGGLGAVGFLGGGGGAPAMVASSRRARSGGTSFGPDGRCSVAWMLPRGLTLTVTSYGISSSRNASGGGGFAGGGRFGLSSGFRFGGMV